MENARKSLYLIVMTLSEVHIQRVHFEPEAPVLIDLVMLMRVTNIETCNAKRVYLRDFTNLMDTVCDPLFTKKKINVNKSSVDSFK